jgi:hypothetical protein
MDLKIAKDIEAVNSGTHIPQVMAGIPPAGASP